MTKPPNITQRVDPADIVATAGTVLVGYGVVNTFPPGIAIIIIGALLVAVAVLIVFARSSP